MEFDMSLLFLGIDKIFEALQPFPTAFTPSAFSKRGSKWLRN